MHYSTPPQKFQFHPLALLWRQLSTFGGLIWLWAIGLTVVTALGINQTALKMPDTTVLTLALAAIAVNGLLFQRRVTLWLATSSTVGVGLSYLLLAWANLWPVTWFLLKTLAQTGWDWLNGTIDVAALHLLQALLAEGHTELFGIAFRITNWLTHPAQRSSTDTLPIHLIWGSAIWLAIGVMCWQIWVYRRAMTAILFPGALLSVAVFFTGKEYGYLALFLAFGLLLQSSLRGLVRQLSWEKRHLDYASDLFLDLNVYVIPAVIYIVVIAFVIPAMSFSQLTQVLNNLLQINAAQVNEVAASFGLNPIPNPAQSTGLQGLPQQHLLGNNPNLSRMLVMRVRTGDFEPMSASEAQQATIPRYRWQSLIFDHYTSRGWVFSANQSNKVESNTPLETPPGPGRKLTQVVQRGPNATNLLHTAGIPTRINRPVEATYGPTGELVGATLKEKIYTAASWLPTHSPTLLRAAGTNYPPEITQTYLTLPNTLPARVKNLAFKLTVAEPTPYDKAVALESYLRTFPYNLNVATPPPNKDVADFFLFDLKEGYCDYYATSMVVMARAIGLPARFVIGYASGTYNAQRAEYRITEADAHSWAQIYFPGIGWVNFEPTAGRPPISRDPATEDDDLPDWASAPLESPSAEELAQSNNALRPRIPLFWWILALVVAAGLVQQWHQWRMRQLSARAMSQLVYRRTLRMAARCGFTVLPGYTPYEFAHNFTIYLEQNLGGIRSPTNLTASLHKLCAVFVHQQYGPPHANRLRRRSLWQTWRSVRFRLGVVLILLSARRHYRRWVSPFVAALRNHPPQIE